ASPTFAWVRRTPVALVPGPSRTGVRLAHVSVGQAHTGRVVWVRRTPVPGAGAVRTQADEAVLRLARRQHGVFSREQAFAAGASARFIERRLAGGRWVRLDNAVYALVEMPSTYLRQLKAAELGSRDAAIAGLAAGALHGLTGFRPVRPEIVVPVDVRARAKLATVHRYAGVRTTPGKGIRGTTVGPTPVDVAARRPRRGWWRSSPSGRRTSGSRPSPSSRHGAPSCSPSSTGWCSSARGSPRGAPAPRAGSTSWTGGTGWSSSSTAGAGTRGCAT